MNEVDGREERRGEEKRTEGDRLGGREERIEEGEGKGRGEEERKEDEYWKRRRDNSNV